MMHEITVLNYVQLRNIAIVLFCRSVTLDAHSKNTEHGEGGETMGASGFT